MPPSTAHRRDDSARELRANEVIAEYLKKAETGSRPSRRQVLEENPQLAHDLKTFFVDCENFSRVADFLAPRPPVPVVAHTAAPSAKSSLFGTSTAPIPYNDLDATPGPEPVTASGIRLGDYELGGELGRGSMGVVYRARQVTRNRPVALKLIPAAEVPTPVHSWRFRVQGEAAVTLTHTNILPVYDVGVFDAYHFVAMKLHEPGELSLENYRMPMLKGRATFDANGEVWTRPMLRARQVDAAGLIVTLARAVHFAHQRGVLHRDLKPNNILFDADEGTPQLTGFGLVKQPFEGDRGVSRPGTALPGSDYQAPELSLGRTREFTTLGDIYSLGAILYYLLTGRPPAKPEAKLETGRLMSETPVIPPSKLNPRVNRDLDAICTQCLRSDPSKRYPTALAVAQDIEHWAAGEPLQARPVGAGTLIWRALIGK